MGKHRIDARTSGPIVLGILVVAVAVAAVYAVTRERDRIAGPGGSQSPTPRPLPEFEFELENVRRITTVADTRAEEIGGAAEQINETLSAMYTAGFVDPAKAAGGAFPEVLATFDRQAARAARRDVADLTLGPQAASVTFVQPLRGRLEVAFLVGTERAPVVAVAHARFRAEAELVGGGTLRIVHAGDYLMRPEGDRWVIAGYEIRGNLGSGASGGASPEVTPT